jgi:hypothetical protein
MKGCRNPMEHIAHAAAIGDEMYFSNPGVLALQVDEMSHGTADTSLAALDDVNHGEGRQRCPGS